jgi:hypothetical protein
MIMGIGTPSSQSKIERPMSEPFFGKDEKEPQTDEKSSETRIGRLRDAGYPLPNKVSHVAHDKS